MTNLGTVHSYLLRVIICTFRIFKYISLNGTYFPNKYLHMATHIDTNTWKMDWKTSYLRLI